MAQVKDSIWGDDPSEIPTAIAVVKPAPDVESQLRQEQTAPEEPASGVESQLKQEQTAPEEFGDERAGMGMGIALFVFVLLGLGVLIASFMFNFVAFTGGMGYDGNYPYLPSSPSPEDYAIYYEETRIYDAYFQEIQTQIRVATTLTIIAEVLYLGAVVIASVLRCGCCCANKYNLWPQVSRWSTATLTTLCFMITASIIYIIGRLIFVEFFGILCNFGIIQVILLIIALVFFGCFTRGR
jgi:hypothetical protein